MQAPVTNAPPTHGPLLLGLLVDVSLSMMRPLADAAGGKSRPGLDVTRAAIDALIARAGELYADGGAGGNLPPLNVFALGFGFRSVSPPLPAPADDGRVRDLLAAPDGSAEPFTPIDRLIRERHTVASRLADLRWQMLGPTTPMAEAFALAHQRIQDAHHVWSGRPTVLVITDGGPLDKDASMRLTRTTAMLKAAGVVVMTCLLTRTRLGEQRRLFGAAGDHWPEAARLMHACCSELANDAPIRGYLEELEWTIEPGARLLTAVDNYDDLSGCLATALRWLGADSSGGASTTSSRSAGRNPGTLASDGGTFNDVRDSNVETLLQVHSIENVTFNLQTSMPPPAPDSDSPAAKD